MKKCTRCLVSLFLAFCLILSLFTGVLAAPSATLIVTTPSGYDSASEVVYRTVDGYITNWGARGEDCGFLSTYAQSFYTGSYLYSNLSKVSGGTSTSNAPSSSLYSSLQTLMVDRHSTFTKYGSSSGLLCKNLYQYTDCTLGDPTYVSTLYRGLTVVGPWDGGVSYNQEHIWPQSKCLGTASTSDIGDIMQLRAANPSENSSRNNTAYGESAAYYDPGVSVRGDCARTLLYMYVRWGNTVNMWGTDGVIESLDVLLRWIKEDPVDTWEMGHNDAVQSITGTRNVFVDYPEYAYLLFGRSVPADLTTPSNGGDPNGGSGGSTESTVATLVTDASTLKAGDQIIIAALDYDAAMSTTQNTNNRGQTPATKSGSILNYGYDAQILTLESGSSSGTFALRAGSGAYLTAASSSGNYLKTKSNIDANSSWTLGVNANTGAAFITANGTYTRNVMRYNSSSALFSCYSANNTQKDIAIYRLGPGSGGSGGTTSSGSASLVTSTSSLKVGDRIIITALDYQAALGTTQNASNRSQGSVTKNGNSLTYGGDVQVLTLESGNVSGTFALQAGSGKYLYAPSSSANHLKTTDTVADNASWTISINSSTGAASITANGGVTRNVMRYNVGSALFSCYAENNKQADLAIYRIADTGVCNHSYSSRITTHATCTAAGVRTYTCILCGDSYTESIASKGHSYSGGSCTSCGAADPNASGGTTYYLVGYINGADHGCESDYENMGNYPLVNGTLTTTFHQDSYIFIKTEGNGRWLMAESYCTHTVCTFIEGGYEKMRVPGGVELTFTLTENANGSVTLSYTQGGSIGCVHSYRSQVTVAPGCTSSGVRTYTCDLCGDSYTETIASTGHSYSATVTAATCSAQGYTTYTCYSCGSSYKSDYTAALGHSYTSSVTTTATCTASGIRTYCCIRCNDRYTEIIPATGHSYVSGKCSVCGTVDPNCSHSYTSKVTAATCTASGVKTYTCTKCDDSYSETIPATGHSYVGGSCANCGAADPNASVGTTYYLVGYINGADHGCESDWQNMGSYPLVNGTLTTTFASNSYIFVKTEGNGKWLLSEAYCEDTTCTFREGGSEKMFVPGGVELTFTLTENSDGSVTLRYTQGGTTGCAHSYSSKITTAATCTSNGVKTYTCTKCGSSYTETIAALGHNYAGGSCTNCGASDPGVVGTTYYLVGYINGADYGCEGDWQNMGSYKFANGKLTATFNQDSYIFVKTEGNGKWLMADAYCEDTVCTFREGGSEKMKVPGGVKLTFNLTENADGSVSLRYSTGSASVVPTLTLKSPTLEFKDMITVNAMFTAENTQDVVEMGMITYSSSVSAPNAATAEHMIPGTTYDTNTGRYIAHSQGIHAKYLGDTVYLAVYARLTDGTYAYSKVAPYSPVQYATSQLKNSTDMKLKQLVAAMLNYGAEAQLFFGHNTGSLANASLTAEQKALPESYRADMVSTVPSASAAKQGSFANNSGFSKRYPAISFEGAFCINYFFTPKYQPANGITLYYWNESDYSAVSVLTAANASGSFKLNGSGTGEYSGDILGISAKNLSEAVYVAAVYESGGTTWTSGVLGYSIGSYCSSQASKGTDVSGLAMATAVYGYQAKQYFG